MSKIVSLFFQLIVQGSEESPKAAIMTGTRQKTSSKKKDLEDKDQLLLESMLKILKCPVCWRQSEPDNLIQCRNGHFGCQPCFTKLKTCPACRINLEPEIITFGQETLKLIQKELRHVESSSVLINVEAILNIFQCINCKFAPTKVPVLQCQKGHVYCYKCSGFSLWCYPCHIISNSKVPWMSFTMRSLAVQEILDSAQKQCRFSRYGCTERIRELNQHEDNCQYHDTYCIIPICINIISLPKLLSHILEDCKWTSKFLQTIDPFKFSAKSWFRISIPWVPPEELIEVSSCSGAILKLEDNKYFMFGYY